MDALTTVYNQSNLKLQKQFCSIDFVGSSLLMKFNSKRLNNI